MEMPEKIDNDRTWQWLSKSDLEIGTEALLCGAQEQATRRNYVKHHIKIRPVKAQCLDYVEKKNQSAQHLVSGCEKLAKRKYTRRHSNEVKKVYWDFCKKNELEHTKKWYEHIPEGAAENEKVKVLWDINVQCDNVIEARRPDIILIDKSCL